MTDDPLSDAHPDLLDGVVSEDRRACQVAFTALCKRVGIEDRYDGPRP